MTGVEIATLDWVNPWDTKRIHYLLRVMTL